MKAFLIASLHPALLLLLCVHISLCALLISSSNMLQTSASSASAPATAPTSESSSTGSFLMTIFFLIGVSSSFSLSSLSLVTLRFLFALPLVLLVLGVAFFLGVLAAGVLGGATVPLVVVMVVSNSRSFFLVTRSISRAELAVLELRKKGHIVLCDRYESAYLGFDINAKPGQSQVAVLGVRERETRHLERGGVSWGFLDDVAVKEEVRRVRGVFVSEGKCWRSASDEDVLKKRLTLMNRSGKILVQIQRSGNHNVKQDIFWIKAGNNSLFTLARELGLSPGCSDHLGSPARTSVWKIEA
ncbi:hypothetical protein KCV05_g210, partial [Aureobasidium melanogenum]